MTLTAFLLIFVSVFMHAAWNFISKKNNPGIAFYAVLCLAGAVPFLILAPGLSGISFLEVPWRFYLLIALSNLFEVCYAVGLCYGYRKSDISLVYPMGRALPVLFIMMLTNFFNYGEKLSVTAILGMVAIFCGCLLMMQTDWNFRLRSYCSKVVFFILMIAIGTTGYTLIDKLAADALSELPGVSTLHRGLITIAAVQTYLAVTMFVLALLIPSERRQLVWIWRHPGNAFWAGVLQAGAYLLVVMAMGMVTNLSFLQAFRQMSLPLGVLAGVFILKEKCPLPKTLGIILIVSALVLLAFC